MEYIASRADPDRDRVGYYGVSMGAYAGIIVNAIQPGLKANVFLGGGLSRAVVPLEMDPRFRVADSGPDADGQWEERFPVRIRPHSCRSSGCWRSRPIGSVTHCLRAATCPARFTT